MSDLLSELRAVHEHLTREGLEVYAGTVDDAAHALDAAEADRAMRREPCIWTEDMDDGAWDGACGVKWVFPAAGPTENRLRFCPRCGHPVEVRETHAREPTP